MRDTIVLNSVNTSIYSFYKIIITIRVKRGTKIPSLLMLAIGLAVPFGTSVQTLLTKTSQFRALEMKGCAKSKVQVITPEGDMAKT